MRVIAKGSRDDSPLDQAEDSFEVISDDGVPPVFEMPSDAASALPGKLTEVLRATAEVVGHNNAALVGVSKIVERVFEDNAQVSQYVRRS